MLLNKGKAARILDKRKDSGAIIKLVEELRQAVLLYQVSTVMNLTDQASLILLGQLSQQQSIDSQITQLTVSPPPNVRTVRADARPIESSLHSVHF